MKFSLVLMALCLCGEQTTHEVLTCLSSTSCCASFSMVSSRHKQHRPIEKPSASSAGLASGPQPTLVSLGGGFPQEEMSVSPFITDSPPPPQSSCGKGKAENKVVLNIHVSWPACVSFLHSSPRMELEANGSPGSEDLPMCKTVFLIFQPQRSLGG